jgi:biopolymer transport protein ExbD
MKFSSSGRRAKAPALALTSMLDVIFLLLCFFVTASVFSQWESEISISLPSASTAETPGRLPGEVILNVARDGSVTVNAKKLALDDLGSRLRKVAEFYPGQPVVIRADRDTSYDSLVKVLDTCREAGVWNFSLATVEDKGTNGK